MKPTHYLAATVAPTLAALAATVAPTVAAHAQGPKTLATTPTVPAAAPAPAAKTRAMHPIKAQAAPTGQPNPLQLLQHMVRANQAYPFAAREVTLTAGGQETEQWVRWNPRAGMRRESVRPTPGDILVDNFHQSWVYSARSKAWTAQDSLLPRPRGRVGEVLGRIQNGELKAEWVGQEVIAGRQADIVRVLPANTAPAETPSRKFWIDRATGLRLKSEDIAPGGKTVSSSYYLSVDLVPQFAPDTFAPPPGVAAVRRSPAQKFRTVEAATQAGIKFRQPTFLPPGFVLREIVAGGRNNTRITQHFANGLSVVTVIQTPEAPFGKKIMEALGATGAGFLSGPNGQRAYLWRDAGAGLNFAVLSNLPDEQIKRIADGVK